MTNHITQTSTSNNTTHTAQPEKISAKPPFTSSSSSAVIIKSRRTAEKIENQRNSSSSNRFQSNLTSGINELHSEMLQKPTPQQIFSSAKEAIDDFFREAAKMKESPNGGVSNLEAIYKKVEEYYFFSQLHKARTTQILPKELTIQKKAALLFPEHVSVSEVEAELRNKIIALTLYNEEKSTLFEDKKSEEKAIKIINYMFKNMSLSIKPIISILDIKKKPGWLQKQLQKLNNPEKSGILSHRNMSGPLPLQEIEKGERLAKQGWSTKDIAKELGINEVTSNRYFEQDIGLKMYGEQQKFNRKPKFFPYSINRA